MKPIYVDATTGQVQSTMNPRIEEELQKSHLEDAFRQSGMTVKKSGKDIRDALNKKKFAYEEQMMNLSNEFNAVAKKMADCGLGTPEFPKFNEKVGGCVNRFKSEMKYEDMNSDQYRCMDEYSDLTWKIRGVKDDLAAANNLLSMLDDNKSYPLDVNQHMVLFA